MKKGSGFFRSLEHFSVENFYPSAAAEEDWIARLDVPGFVAGDAIDIHNK